MYCLIPFAIMDLGYLLTLASRDSFVAKRKKKVASAVWC